MNILDVNIGRSKKNGKLIFDKHKIESIIDFIIYAGVVALLPIYSIYSSCMSIGHGDSILRHILFLIFIISLSYLFYHLHNKVDNLVTIKGELSETNRTLIKEIAERHKWTVVRDLKQMTILSSPWDISSTLWGRYLTVIYDKEDICINVTTYGRHGLKSYFHWLANRKAEKKFQKEFELKLQAIIK